MSEILNDSCSIVDCSTKDYPVSYWLKLLARITDGGCNAIQVDEQADINENSYGDCTYLSPQSLMKSMITAEGVSVFPMANDAEAPACGLFNNLSLEYLFKQSIGISTEAGNCPTLLVKEVTALNDDCEGQGCPANLSLSQLIKSTFIYLPDINKYVMMVVERTDDAAKVWSCDDVSIWQLLGSMIVPVSEFPGLYAWNTVYVGVDVTNNELRDDGGIELRDDGGIELRD